MRVSARVARHFLGSCRALRRGARPLSTVALEELKQLARASGLAMRLLGGMTGTRRPLFRREHCRSGARPMASVAAFSQSLDLLAGAMRRPAMSRLGLSLLCRHGPGRCTTAEPGTGGAARRISPSFGDEPGSRHDRDQAAFPPCRTIAPAAELFADREQASPRLIARHGGVGARAEAEAVRSRVVPCARCRTDCAINMQAASSARRRLGWPEGKQDFISILSISFWPVSSAIMSSGRDAGPAHPPHVGDQRHLVGDRRRRADRRARRRWHGWRRRRRQMAWPRRRGSGQHQHLRWLCRDRTDAGHVQEKRTQELGRGPRRASGPPSGEDKGPAYNGPKGTRSMHETVAPPSGCARLSDRRDLLHPGPARLSSTESSRAEPFRHGGHGDRGWRRRLLAHEIADFGKSPPPSPLAASSASSSRAASR